MKQEIFIKKRIEELPEESGWYAVAMQKGVLFTREFYITENKWRFFSFDKPQYYLQPATANVLTDEELEEIERKAFEAGCARTGKFGYGLLYTTFEDYKKQKI